MVVEVSDTGTGMDADTQQRCLEPFFTTKGERGTGLGLAMVYGMMQRHGAEISIDSAPGRGTTVGLSFAQAGPGVDDAGTATSEALVLPRLRLLLVDDDALVLGALSKTLASDGHSVETAGGGRAGIEAVHAAEASGRPFDAVITDLGMPYVDGLKVASAVKLVAAATPVLLLTGWGQRLRDDAEVPSNVDAVLSKPPKLAAIREALARFCTPAATAADACTPDAGGPA